MYGGRQPQIRDIRSFILRGGTPITFVVLALAVVSFLVALVSPATLATISLAFSVPYGLRAPWTLITWPFAADTSGLIGTAFAMIWFYTTSASMERAWGTRDYGLFLAATTVLTALTMGFGSAFGPGRLAGLWVFAAPPTIAWCMTNRRESVNLYFVPIPAPALALLSVVLVWFYAGAAQGRPLLGLFAISGSAAAYWYATQGRYSSRSYGTSRHSSNTPYGGLRVSTGSTSAPRTSDRERVTPPTNPLKNPLAWLRARLRRRKEDKEFVDILRRSGFSDPDDEKTRR